MLRHLTEWLKDVAGMWIFIGILTISLLVFSTAKHFGFTANVKIASVNQELNALSYEKYNGINLTGSEVINAIKRYQEKLPVTVYTGESVDTYKGSFKPANNNRKSEKYIKPSQTYTGSLLKNSDSDIVGLVFAKEGILLTETSYKELLAKLVGTNPEDTTMDSIVSQINSLIRNKDVTIAALNQNISSLNTSVSNLQSQNNSLQSQKNSLYSQLSTSNANYFNLQKEVTNGKNVMANAITNKGVPTSASSDFTTMAQNINNISGNLEYVTGNAEAVYVSGSGYTSTYSFSTTSLSFAPSLICGTIQQDYGNAYIYAIYNKGTWIIGNSEDSNVGTAITRYSNGFDLRTYANFTYNRPKFAFYAFR